MNWRIVFLIILLLVCGAYLQGKDFSYTGADCTILYRFTPHTGTLNDLTVTYNGAFTFYPALYGGITTFILAGKQLHPWEEKHSSILENEKNSGDIYEAAFRWSYKNESLRFTIKMQLTGKILTIEFSTPTSNKNVLEFGCDRSADTLSPKIIYLPYGHHVLFSRGVFISALIDHLFSNASAVISLNEYYSNTSALYGQEAHYHPLTDGRRNHLKEKMYLSVSPDITETFFHVSNPASPYKKALENKVIIDLWSGRFANYRDALKTLADMGMTDLFALLHAWQRYGYDNGLPTTFPAGDDFGGEKALLEVVDVCEANDYLFALHTNYVDFYTNSDVWNSNDVALKSDGSWIKSWYNSYTGMQSYLMKPSKVSYYAGLYEPSIHHAYRTNAAFLDVHSSVLPSYKVDFDAHVAGAGKQIATFHHYKDLLSYTRSAHAGPVAGEGFGSSTYIWAGYVDAIEADPRATFNIGGEAVPLIVDYKFQELHELFVPHGAGYLERFFLDKWDGYTIDELEKYRVTQLAFGNAGFIHNPFDKDLPSGEVLKDYCFLKQMQRYYLPEKPQQVLYRVGAELLTLSPALQKILPTTPRDKLNSILNEELSMLKIIYPGGFTLYVNRSAAKTWDIEKDGVIYKLPANGFLAYKGDDFLAYTASVNGEKHYYMYPKESVCCREIAPFFLNAGGRREANRSLLQVEYIDILNWQLYQGEIDIKAIRVYLVEGGDRRLLAELSPGITEFMRRCVEKDKLYKYALVTVDSLGRESEPVYLSIR